MVTLPIGRPFPVVQNTIYALPGTLVTMFSDAAAPTYFQSTTEAFTLSVAVTLVNGQAQLAGAFIRCTSATPGNIILKS